MSEPSQLSQLEFATKIRVRYSETDQMGYCYYGNYDSFFDVASVEALRQNGIYYKELEHLGILLPVKKFEITYLQPAKYDDLLEIKTRIIELAGVRIGFSYKTYSDAGQLLNEAYTLLVFVNAQTQKPMPIPEFIFEQLIPAQ